MVAPVAAAAQRDAALAAVRLMRIMVRNAEEVVDDVHAARLTGATPLQPAHWVGMPEGQLGAGLAQVRPRQGPVAAQAAGRGWVCLQAAPLSFVWKPLAAARSQPSRAVPAARRCC